jgi:TPR repeat protein
MEQMIEAICLALLAWGAYLCIFGRDRRVRARRFFLRNGNLGRRSADIIGVVVLALGTFAIVPRNAAGADLAGEHLDKGLLAYEQGQYVLSQTHLTAAARRGDARAQEMLGLMYMVGPQVYPGVTQDLTQAANLLDRAARSGQPVARYMYCALVRRQTLHLPTQGFCAEQRIADGAVTASADKPR